MLLLLRRCCCCPGLLFLKVGAPLGTTCSDLFLFAKNSARSQEPTQLQVYGWTFSANVFFRVLDRHHSLGTCPSATPYSSPCLTATLVNDHARGHKRNRDWIVIGYEMAVFNHHSDRDWSFITGAVEVS